MAFNQQQANMLAESFWSSKSQEDFRKLYDELTDVRRQSERIVMRNGFGAHDAQEIFDDTLLKVVRREGIEDFYRTFIVSLKNARTDFYRKERRRTSRLWNKLLPPPPANGDDAPTLESARDEESEYFTEDVCERLDKKKMTEQRQLLDHLLESAKIQDDPILGATVDGIECDKTINAIAKSLGLPRNTVYRKLRRLSKYYDEKVFGDLRDYLPSSIRLMSKFAG